MSILHPLRSVIRRGYTRYIFIALWVGATLASIPNIIQTQYFQPENQSRSVCSSGIYQFLTLRVIFSYVIGTLSTYANFQQKI